MTIRVAAIEVSHWHAVHDPAYLPKLQRIPGVTIAALHDPDERMAASRAAEVGNPPIYTDYRLMLEQVKPDFVLALGRHSMMAQYAHYLLDHDFPFIIEKPVGFNTDEAESVTKKAEAKGAFAAVLMPVRFSEFFREARRGIDESRFGPLSHIYIRMNRYTSARYPEWGAPWMLDPAVSNGGCLRNLGSHGFDTFLALVDGEASVVGAQISRRARGQPVDDYASVLLRSKSGVMGTIEVGNAFPKLTGQDSAAQGTRLDEIGWSRADGEWKVCGRDALLSAKDGMLRWVTVDSDTERPCSPETSVAFQALKETLEYFQAGKPPPVPVRHGYRATKLIDEAYALAGKALT